MISIKNFCNVPYMPIFEGKRLEFVGVKFNEAEKNQFEKIGEDQDRAMSYVVRELALRGLVQYLKDHQLKATKDEIATARVLLGVSDGQELTTQTKGGSPRITVGKKPKAA